MLRCFTLAFASTSTHIAPQRSPNSICFYGGVPGLSRQGFKTPTPVQVPIAGVVIAARERFRGAELAS